MSIPVEEKVLATEDFYEILNIPKTAEDKEIIKAYRKLALKLHPDRNQAPRAVQAFQKLERIHSALLDPRKRSLYDESGSKGLDEYESRGEQPDFDIKRFAMHVISSSFFFTWKPCTDKRERNFAAGPMNAKEALHYRSGDTRVIIFTFLILMLGGMVSVLDADQRSAVMSFTRDESRRYIFEESTKFASKTVGRSSVSHAALGATAGSVKYHMRWKRTTLGDATSDALGSDVVRPVLEEDCLNEHRIAQAYLLRRHAATTPAAKNGGGASVRKIADGRASFTPRLARSSPAKFWASWNATTTSSSTVDDDEDDDVLLLPVGVVTAQSPLSLSPQCVPPRMKPKRKVVM